MNPNAHLHSRKPQYLYLVLMLKAYPVCLNRKLLSHSDKPNHVYSLLSSLLIPNDDPALRKYLRLMLYQPISESMIQYRQNSLNLHKFFFDVLLHHCVMDRQAQNQLYHGTFRVDTVQSYFELADL